ncbi:MAG: pantetheine-phosphate adenylyltransferase [Alphaproteobacteria bacterium]|nr:pantetheine-phosphate adenylyltransferase [Alphaproteobacteria bacterium]OJV47609.1 MAG: pantetheine-phosphate adenylyltransferase [Alphaproteobacteria bacterium 43-37]
MSQSIGLYPGTFDPITRGHLDIIARAAQLMDKLIIGVATNGHKIPLFDLETRVAMVQEDITTLKEKLSLSADIVIVPFDMLLIKFAAQNNVRAIIRGLRAVSDFEYEFQMAAMNLRLNSQIETIFLMATDKYQFISSSMVKEIGRLGGDISQFVSPHVVRKIQEIYNITP